LPICPTHHPILANHFFSVDKIAESGNFSPFKVNYNFGGFLSTSLWNFYKPEGVFC